MFAVWLLGYSFRFRFRCKIIQSLGYLHKYSNSELCVCVFAHCVNSAVLTLTAMKGFFHKHINLSRTLGVERACVVRRCPLFSSELILTVEGVL